MSVWLTLSSSPSPSCGGAPSCWCPTPAAPCRSVPAGRPARGSTSSLHAAASSGAPARCCDSPPADADAPLAPDSGSTQHLAFYHRPPTGWRVERIYDGLIRRLNRLITQINQNYLLSTTETSWDVIFFSTCICWFLPPPVHVTVLSPPPASCCPMLYVLTSVPRVWSPCVRRVIEQSHERRCIGDV